MRFAFCWRAGGRSRYARSMNRLFAHAVLFVALTFSVLAAPEAFEVGPDRLKDLPQGKEADGIAGDFVMRNDTVEVLISGNLPERRANMSTFYGADGMTP